jgi:antitoxin HigA-1
MEKYIPIPHIGKILLEEFLEPLNMSQNALAKAIGVPANRINAIIKGQRGITADTDLRLAKYFGMSKGFFIGLQEDFELMAAERELKEELAKIVPFKYKKTKKIAM